ncbi:MAG: hypothetical protein ACOC3Z_02990 [Nanoarchaeota archaeon]
MPTQDTSGIKEKIIQTLKTKGPSLPSTIAKEINMDMLCASAFLSELLSERKIKTSTLKVGSSPVYLLYGQEHQLERFSHHMKNKEKEAYDLLKNNKFLKDTEQYWKYLTINNSEIEELLSPKSKQKETIIENQKQEKSEPKKEEPEDNKQDKKELNIFEKQKTENIEQKETNLEKKETNESNQEEPIQKKKTIKKKTTKKKSSNTKNEKFFNKVKEHLNKNSIEIIDFEGFSKNDLKLRIKKSEQEYLLVAYNKKRITEKDILDAYKKAQEKNMKYIILSLGEPAKKTTNFIDAAKNLQKIDKID